MSSRDFWDTRYAEEGFAYGTTPNVFLSSFREQLQAGMKALVIGDGEGRNGVWLAEQGLDVTSVDLSAVGVEKAAQLASQRGVKLTTVCTDLCQWQWPKDYFDVVVIIFVHFAPDVREYLHQQVIAALKPGGQVIMESYTPQQLAFDTGGPRDLEMLYTAEMMAADFAGMEIKQLEECVVELAEGRYHCGTSAVVRLWARRATR